MHVFIYLFPGIIIGLLQLPLVLALKDTLGSSSSYSTIVSQWVVTKRLQEIFPYMASKRCGIDNWWQVTFFLIKYLVYQIN